MCECEREISNYTSKVFTSHLYFIKIEKYCPLSKLCYPQSIPNTHVLTDVFVAGSKLPRSSWLLHNLLVHPRTKYNRQVVRSPKERELKLAKRLERPRNIRRFPRITENFETPCERMLDSTWDIFFYPQGAGHVFWWFWFDTISWPLKHFLGSINLQNFGEINE